MRLRNSRQLYRLQINEYWNKSQTKGIRTKEIRLLCSNTLLTRPFTGIPLQDRYLWSSFPQLLWQFRLKTMWGQVTKSGQVTQLQNNFPIAPRLQCFRESYETFGKWWGHQCLPNISFFYIGDLTSGHFCDLPIISQWAKNQLRYIYFGASLFEWNHIV